MNVSSPKEKMDFLWRRHKVRMRQAALRAERIDWWTNLGMIAGGLALVALLLRAVL